MRTILASGAFLAAAVGLLPVAATFAQAGPLPAPVDRVRTQRPIADDFEIDQSLVAALPVPVATVSAPAAAAEASTPGEPPKEDSDLQIAAIAPAMRRLVTQFNALWPTHGEITTYFGERGPYSPRGHAGLDVAGPEGTPVVAIDDGEVLKAYWNGEGYGGLVIIAHPSGFETWYGHLGRFDVEPGEMVQRGQQIALMGSTGFSTGSHLHIEVRQDGQQVDPLEFLQEANLEPADQ